MMRSANPNAWNVSTLRAWMPSAWPISSRPGRRSTMRVVTSGNCASCAAAIMPAGPEPTISTSTSSGSSSGGRCRRRRPAAPGDHRRRIRGGGTARGSPHIVVWCAIGRVRLSNSPFPYRAWRYYASEPRQANRAGPQKANPATRFTSVARITAPNRYASRACLMAAIRIDRGRDVRVRHLERHADGEREVGEVPVGRRFDLVEVDAALTPGVVQHRVAQGVQRVDQEPRQHHAQDGDTAEDVALRASLADVSTSTNTVTTRLARLASTSSTSLIVRVGSSR